MPEKTGDIIVQKDNSFRKDPDLSRKLAEERARGKLIDSLRGDTQPEPTAGAVNVTPGSDEEKQALVEASSPSGKKAAFLFGPTKNSTVNPLEQFLAAGQPGETNRQVLPNALGTNLDSVSRVKDSLTGPDNTGVVKPADSNRGPSGPKGSTGSGTGPTS